MVLTGSCLTQTERRDTAGADALYRRSIESYPSDPQALVDYADFLVEQKADRDGAEQLLRKAVEVRIARQKDDMLRSFLVLPTPFASSHPRPSNWIRSHVADLQCDHEHPRNLSTP